MAKVLININSKRPSYDTHTRKRRRAYIVSCLQRNFSIRRDGVPDIPFAERKRYPTALQKLTLLPPHCHPFAYLCPKSEARS